MLAQALPIYKNLGQIAYRAKVQNCLALGAGKVAAVDGPTRALAQIGELRLPWQGHLSCAGNSVRLVLKLPFAI
jgi:hypothetical protein